MPRSLHCGGYNDQSFLPLTDPTRLPRHNGQRIGDAGDRPRGNADTKVVLQTNWLAQPEHGGFYQAIANGIYADHGLDVELIPGGPQTNNAALLMAGKIDFSLAQAASALNFVREDAPFLAVAAIFQKDPLALLAHPDVLAIEELKGHPIFVSQTASSTWWPFIRSNFGLSDDQLKPYTFSIAPFMADPTSAQQGFITSEPLLMEKAGVTPSIFLLSDFGYESYQTTIETSRQMVEEKPEVVQSFVDASILGWQSYLRDDPAPANALIKKDNPDIDDEKIAYARQTMIDNGLVESGQALTDGIGAMNADKWQAIYDLLAAAGGYPEGMDIAGAFDLAFVNKKVGT
jgi:NitT/TauT family transport system substrate-binding protein